MEFSVAAYRFGHSQVRPSYRANFGTSATDRTLQFFAVIFDHTATGTDPADLRGGCRAPRRFIDWQTFFDFGGGQVRQNKRIDTKLSSTLFHLLGQPSDEPDSLAIRNLVRGLTLEVPSGQRVAAAMQETPLHESDLADLEPFGLHKRTPLWFYVLREADVARRRRAPGAGRRADRRRGVPRAHRRRPVVVPVAGPGLDPDLRHGRRRSASRTCSRPPAWSAPWPDPRTRSGHSNVRTREGWGALECGRCGVSDGGEALGRDQLGDLDRVQRGALAEVVVADEQRETAAALDALVLAQTADERRVLTGGLQRRRHVGQLDARGVGQQLGGALRASADGRTRR